jgi:hypothetical protein
MSGGRASRQKGNRTERAIVRALQDTGFAAERVPLSGSVRGRFCGDVSVPLLAIDRRVVVLRLRFACEIAALAEQTKNSCEAGSAAGRIRQNRGVKAS